MNNYTRFLNRIFVQTFALTAITLLAQNAYGVVPKITALVPMGGQAGTTVTVSIEGTTDKEKNSGVWCSRSDLKLEFGEKPNILKITIPENAEPGIAWIRLHTAEGASDLKPFEIGILPEVKEVEPNNLKEQAQKIEHSSVIVNGVVQKSGETDMYRVPLEVGQTLVASVQANSKMGSPMDTVLQILSPRGFVLLQNDDNLGLDPFATYTATEAGEYLIRVFAFPSKTNQSIRFSGANSYVYRLTLSTGPYVDHTAPLAVSSKEATKVRLFGWNLPQELHELTIPPSNEVTTSVFKHAEVTNVIESDTTTHQQFLEREPNEKETPQQISIPAVVTGQIHQPKDLDLFEFEAKKGQKVVIRLVSREKGFPLDPVIRVLDEKGKQLKEFDDVSRDHVDAVFDYSFPNEGKHRIEVRDRFNNGGYRFMYRLEITPATPEYTATLAATKFTLTGAKPLEIPIKISRKRGYKQKLRFDVHGLPEGITATVPFSEPKGDSSKEVKLVLNSKYDFTSTVPLQIEAVAVLAKTEPPTAPNDENKEPKTIEYDGPKQPVLATITNMKQQTENFWLTAVVGVNPKKDPVKAEK